MNKGRLEAFSDGVIAIIITIMVLEMKVPHGERPPGAASAPAGLSQLRAELRLRRHLLEQSPPHAPCHRTRHRRHALGKSSSSVLALAVSVRHRMDGRKPLRTDTIGALRPRSADGGRRLLDLAATHHRLPRPRLRPQEGYRQRLEGKTLSSALCARHGHQPSRRRGLPRRSTFWSRCSGSSPTAASSTH